MQSAVSEATGFVHYARAARFFPQVRFGIKVSEPVRQSGRGRGSPGWIGRAARHAWRGEARRGSGLAGGRICRPAGTVRRGKRVQGRGSASWKRACGRPLLPPRKAQPEGDAGERARSAGMHGEGGAEKRTRACGGRICRFARHSPKGQCRGEGRRGADVRGSGGTPWKRACGGAPAAL